MKIVINDCYGGFRLSHEAVMMYSDLAGLNLEAVQQENTVFATLDYDYYINGDRENELYYYGYGNDIPRDDANLVKVVETLGEKANSWSSKLKIVEIPDNVEWHIAEYDGIEHVAENHRTWS